MKRIVTAAASLALLAACGEDWEGEGIIVEHQYDDDDSYWVPRAESCSGSGLNTICTASGGYTAQQPERWLLVVQDDQGAEHTVSVPYDVYQECSDTYRLVSSTMECFKAGGA